MAFHTSLIIATFAFGLTAGCTQSVEQPVKNWRPQIVVKSSRPKSSTKDEEVRSYGLTREDVNQITTTVPTVKQLVFWRSMPASISGEATERSSVQRIIGSTADLATVASLEIVKGRFLTARDQVGAGNVLLLDASLSRELFPGTDPIGEVVVVNQEAFKVVGVFRDAKTDDPLGERIRCVLPYKTMRKVFGDLVMTKKEGAISAESYELSGCIIEVDHPADMDKTKRMVEELIARVHDDDVEVRDTMPKQR